LLYVIDMDSGTGKILLGFSNRLWQHGYHFHVRPRGTQLLVERDAIFAEMARRRDGQDKRAAIFLPVHPQGLAIYALAFNYFWHRCWRAAACNCIGKNVCLSRDCRE
jgi:hypothetical protein